jgi:CHASE2 domain-containing sensor protein
VSLREWLAKHCRGGAGGAALAVLLGLLFNFSRLGNGLAHLSYDLPCLLGTSTSPAGVLIVQMDEGQPGSTNSPLLDRAALARLIDHLRTNQVSLVVLDVVLDLPGSSSADERLAGAISAHGNVVLAAVEESQRRRMPGMKLEGLHAKGRQPHEKFLTAARNNWGLCDLTLDSDSAVRRQYPGTDLYPSLPWKAAMLLGAAVTRDEAHRREPRWLRYYGEGGTLPTLTCAQALRQTREQLAGKLVFIGKGQRTPFVDDEPDEFRTPYTTWNGRGTAGTEILATTFLNLWHQDWLRGLPAWVEVLLLLACGIGFGLGLGLCRPLPAAGVALAGALLIGLGATLLAWHFHSWFAWATVAVVQIPCALGWSVISHATALGREKDRLQAEARRLAREKKKLEKALSKTPPPASASDALPISTAGQTGSATIKDFTLLKRVGAGAYGEVWLARNAVGMLQAVKLMHRDKLASAANYEREFNGVRSYMPISLDHPGLLRVLHVGRNDQAGFYYYVMELADDETRGREFEASTYEARNLARDLSARGRLPLRDCVDLGLALAAALDFLHSRGLVHRDIKPSNIVFVNGRPKLADMGLVTEMDRSDMSLVGTPAFMDKALQGTPAGDLASLGRVLYVGLTGCAPEEFPRMPPDLGSETESAALAQFKTIILRACQLESFPPYPSAKDLQSDLLRLQNELSLGLGLGAI